MRIRVGAATDVGRARERNEDSLLAAPPLYAVADGMGGHRGGNVASALALQVLSRVGDGSWDRLADQVKEANRAILERAQGDRSLSGMGTTLTAAFMEGDVIHLAHVGDSRAYLLRDGELHRLTEDHTLVHRMAMEGRITEAEEETHPQRSILIRALGVEEPVEVDEVPVHALAGDRILLCSDGLHSMVPEEDIRRTLEAASDAQEAADHLVELANRAGGLDNITVVVLEFEPGEGVDLADRAARDSVRDGGGDGGDGGARATEPDSGAPPSADAESAPAAPDVPPAPAGSDITQIGAVPIPPGRVRRDDTAVMRAPGGTTTATMSAPTTVPPTGTFQRNRKRRRRRLLAWIGGLVLLLVAAGVGFRLYLDTQWFVGVDGGKVAVFRGIPSEFIGAKLYGLVERTDLSAAAVQPLRSSWQDLQGGLDPVSSKAKADLIVTNMRARLTEVRQTGAEKSTSG
ncbi:MAG: Stp1/IreP family PP2C-type Ser/Thr phosphatase [Actinomycetota bacterium]|nr:Stp1/IreP family PP2C-type Ser/Thr phosphatase [Actinomycetota bacterium]